MLFPLSCCLLLAASEVMPFVSSSHGIVQWAARRWGPKKDQIVDEELVEFGQPKPPPAVTRRRPAPVAAAPRSPQPWYVVKSK